MARFTVRRAIRVPVAGVYEPDAEIRAAGLRGPVVLRAYVS